MSPLEYLEEIVLPTIDEFQADGSSRRKAYLACIVTIHLKDYLTKDNARNVEKTVRNRAEAAFDVVSAVANGAKHSISGRGGQIRFHAGSDFYWPSHSVQTLPSGVSLFGDSEGGTMIPADTYYSASVMEAVRTLVRTFVLSFHDNHFAGFEVWQLDRLNFPYYLICTP
jgi:hypothetical protein